jgi:hypothetical protein
MKIHDCAPAPRICSGVRVASHRSAYLTIPYVTKRMTVRVARMSDIVTAFCRPTLSELKPEFWNKQELTLILNLVSDDYHEVVEQKYGMWQSKCFDKNKPPSQEELDEMCRSIGYRNVKTAQARTRPDDSKIAGTLL